MAGFGVLLDIDGVLHVGEEPLAGAREAVEALRRIAAGLRLVTNTTSRSRRDVVQGLRRLGFELEEADVLTPAALAVAHCREHGYSAVSLLVSDSLREDLQGLEEVGSGEPADAVILGDLGDGFTATVLNEAFRRLLDGAALVALQHNRYWRSSDGLVLDVGAWSAALEYGSGREATVVGKPARAFFATALGDMGVERAVMVGDDVEADVGGALDAGLLGVLVRSGKFREDVLAASGVQPTAVVDSIADVPALVRDQLQERLTQDSDE